MRKPRRSRAALLAVGLALACLLSQAPPAPAEVSADLALAQAGPRTMLGLGEPTASRVAGALGFGWARQLGGGLEDAGLGVAVDGSGNVYATGSFQGTADFDPGPGIFNLTSAGGYDVFVSKLDAAGNLVWARQVGGTSDDWGRGVAVDGSGNVYPIGGFQGTADFDPGPGALNLTSAGSSDVFVSKLDAAGNLVWARQAGESELDEGYGVAVDGSGKVYATGFFRGTADFDPGPGALNLTAAGEADVFVWKLDALGNLSWARQLGGTSGEGGRGVAVDGSGNVHTTGAFLGTADFDPGPGTLNLTSAGGADVFVSKLDAAGNLSWARQLGGTFDDQGRGVAVDGSGNVHTTGLFQGTADFDPGPGTFNLTSAGVTDVFVSKLDAAGNLSWARQLGGTSFDWGQAVAVDGPGNVYATGYFLETADFDPGPGTLSLTSAGSSDAFVWKLDELGSLSWAGQLGGTSDDVGYGVAVDGSGNVYATGYFQGTADFDPGPGTLSLTSAGGNDAYVAELLGGAPDDFGKTAPADGATGLWSPITLSWGTATGDGVGYRYCVDTINNGACDFGWYGTGTATSALVEAVSFNTTYYWQVQAYNGGGFTDADSGTWASFSTPAGPAGFGKTAPANGATGVALNPTPLTWGSEAYADYFVYCLDTTNDDVCDGGYWTPIGMVTSIDRFGLAPNTTYYWQVYAQVQTWGPVYADGGAWWSFTTAPALQEMTFLSFAVYDGWVLEENESSGKGGTFDAGVATARVGDDASDRQWRSILHFDTSLLPNDAVVTGVTLRVKRQAMVGANPFDSLGYLTVDQKTGAYHENPALEKLDFHAVGSRGNVGRFIKTPASGWYRAPLRAPSYPLVSLTGTTQFRLRFATDDNDNGVADYLSFYTGNAVEADRPQLIVTYYVP